MSYQLTFESTGQVLDVEDGQTILDAALRAGIYLPHACCHGLCATCKIEVTDGEVDHGAASNFALMDYEREEGKAFVNIGMSSPAARPRSSLLDRDRMLSRFGVFPLVPRITVSYLHCCITYTSPPLYNSLLLCYIDCS